MGCEATAKEPREKAMSCAADCLQESVKARTLSIELTNNKYTVPLRKELRVYCKEMRYSEGEH